MRAADRPCGRAWARARLRPGRAGRRDRATPPPSRSRSCPAGRRHPLRATAAACSWGTCGACPWPASRVGCTCTRASSERLVVEPALLLGRLGAPRPAADERLRRREPGLRRGHPDGHPRPHQPDRPSIRCWAPTTTASGPRFPDMSAVWDPELRARLHAAAARRSRWPSPRASTLGLTGPDLRDARRGAHAARRWAPTRWACPRSWRPSRRTGPGCASAASRWSPTRAPASRPTPLSHEEVLEAARGGRAAPGPGHRALRGGPRR